MSSAVGHQVPHVKCEVSTKFVLILKILREISTNLVGTNFIGTTLLASLQRLVKCHEDS